MLRRGSTKARDNSVCPILRRTATATATVTAKNGAREPRLGEREREKEAEKWRTLKKGLNPHFSVHRTVRNCLGIRNYEPLQCWCCKPTHARPPLHPRSLSIFNLGPTIFSLVKLWAELYKRSKYENGLFEHFALGFKPRRSRISPVLNKVFKFGTKKIDQKHNK